MNVSALSHLSACRLSRVFNQACDLRNPEDRRINEWLKALIVASRPDVSEEDWREIESPPFRPRAPSQ